MRFATFHTSHDPTQRFGARLGDTHIIDLERATAARLGTLMPQRKAAEIAKALTPSEAVSFIAGGEMALAAAHETLAFVEMALAGRQTVADARGKPVVFRSDDIVLDPPIPYAGKFIAAGKNFREHSAEMSGRSGPDEPVAFAQMNPTFIGHDKAIPVPIEARNFDYEVEVAVIIGKPAFRVSVDEAMDYAFGFTIFNDLSAREIGRAEQVAGIPLFSKNLANSAPMGPHIVTMDEFNDPLSVGLRMRVNGELRQNSTLKNMLFDMRQIISWWSLIGLEPGDILSSGTPKGVASGRKPGQTPWWLKSGDEVEAEVDGIGVLRTTFV